MIGALYGRIEPKVICGTNKKVIFRLPDVFEGNNPGVLECWRIVKTDLRQPTITLSRQYSEFNKDRSHLFRNSYIFGHEPEITLNLCRQVNAIFL